MGQTLTTPRASSRQVEPPVNVVRLMDAIGPTMAAARLGVSTTLLHKAKKENEINRVVEVAATAVLEHLSDGLTVTQTPQPRVTRPHAAGTDTLFLLSIPADKAPAIQKMVEVLGAELVATA